MGKEVKFYFLAMSRLGFYFTTKTTTIFSPAAFTYSSHLFQHPPPRLINKEMNK